MDDKGKKTLYNVFGALLGIGLMISLTAAIYGHLWLSEFEGPASDLAVIISDDVAAEKSRMEDVRLFGAVFSVVGLSLIIAITPGYNQLLDSPRWQTKKSLGIGLLMILGGSLFYFLSGDLMSEAIGLALIGFGLFSVVADSIYLTATAPE